MWNGDTEDWVIGGPALDGDATDPNPPTDSRTTELALPTVWR